ncbi:hypothetical protein [Zhouia amylolytica]|uniref:hypothetical protein n=1 Tax=Zhouia amylolytica TaxID=376730 RepID=UPI0020CFA8C1|nr:hypothetical protein [Zhouia amylolytica]MCQ0112086.1 hypothetical protein [Zhouia amylolytica]
MKALIMVLLFGLTSLGFAQSNHGIFDGIILEDVVVTPLNMDYLNTVRDEWTPKKALQLQERAARFDIRDTEEFKDGSSPFAVEFYGSHGKIKAVYSEEGYIISAVERFKNIALPAAVMEMVCEEHPGWAIVADKYINQYSDNDIVKREYQLKLSKDKLNKNITINLLAVVKE